jgi:hypothetical protein
MGWQDAPLVNAEKPTTGGSWKDAPLAAPKDAALEGANKYALSGDAKNDNMLTQFLGGAKHSWDKAAYGLEKLVTGSTAKEHEQQLEEGKGYVKRTGPASTVGELVGDIVPYAATAAATGGASIPATMAAQGATGFAVTPGEWKDKAFNGALAASGEGAVRGIGKAVSGLLRGPEQLPKMATDVAKARELGYVVPPSHARGSLADRLLEGLAGKQSTAQNVSAKNQDITHNLVARSLGLPEGELITSEALQGLRTEAGKAYNALESFPARAAEDAIPLMNKPAVEGINPKQMVYDLRVARNDADAYYKAYGRSADPEQLTKAKAAKAKATEIENKLEEYAQSVGPSKLVPELRDARKLIAKTHTVESALNPGSGNIDAKQLAKALTKGKPLEGELKDVAEFALQFPKAVQMTEKMGSLPQTSPWEYGTAGLASLFSNPAAFLTLGARPAARKLLTSDTIQNRLVQGAKPTEKAVSLARLLTEQGLQGTSNFFRDREE